MGHDKADQAETLLRGEELVRSGLPEAQLAQTAEPTDNEG
jgi:hypothetical protein